MTVGERLSYGGAIRQVVEEAVLADRLGVDVFTVGEHHRSDYAISAPEIVLSAVASRSTRMRVGTGVTVLSSDDPVRVHQRFATLDAIAPGRTEVILGRGSFTESFALFGYDLANYEQLFEEKLDLFVKLLDEKPVTWSGQTRAALTEADIYPKTESGRIPTWIGVGGTPNSIVRAARYGLPVMLAIIGGDPARFVPYVDLYERASQQFGTPSHALGMHSPGFIADTDADAAEFLFPHYKANRDKVGRERGWPPVRREAFDAEIAHGSLYVGSPETVAHKIARAVEALGVRRFDLIYTAGPIPTSARLRAVELYGKEVIPMVKELLGKVRRARTSRELHKVVGSASWAPARSAPFWLALPWQPATR
ncbi:Atu2307/SP_0267 family LLM class monooxygenase [Streptomyces canus]|uniref:Atu2307/SP_0267 family LLM class monooxygenase n=1 Tax=Streptomyces canus TaxID=58343 RepID=UPI00381A1706